MVIAVNLVTKTVQNVQFLDYYLQLPPRRVFNTKGINMSTNKKRYIKDKLKEYQSIIENFILSKSNLLERSIGVYKHVREDFVKFSLSIFPNVVPKYMRWRFKLDSNLTDLNYFIKHSTRVQIYIVTIFHFY